MAEIDKEPESTQTSSEQQTDLEFLQTMVESDEPATSPEQVAEDKRQTEQIRKLTGQMLKPATEIIAKVGMKMAKLPTDIDKDDLDLLSECTLDTIEHYYPDFNLPVWMGLPITFGMICAKQAAKKELVKVDDALDKSSPGDSSDKPRSVQVDAMKAVGEE